MSALPDPQSHQTLLADLKQRSRAAQVRAALAVNRELVLLYWDIGQEILARQGEEGWGSKVVERPAKDLRPEFPEMKGFSRTNLMSMRAFAEAWSEEAIVQQVAEHLPWFHNGPILDKVKLGEDRLWYTQAAIHNGWSRNVLIMQIETNLYRRPGNAITNLQASLPSPPSDLAQPLIKDPCDFLTLGQQAQERDLQRALLADVQQFLLELGVGFALVGSQALIQVGDEEFRIDLLFYPLKLRAYIVVDLKMSPFKPEYAGKMNFYLSAVDDLLRHPDDKPLHRFGPVQGQEWVHGRVCRPRHCKARGRGGIPLPRTAPRATDWDPALDRRDRGGTRHASCPNEATG